MLVPMLDQGPILRWGPVLGRGSCAGSGVQCWVRVPVLGRGPVLSRGSGAPWNSENSFIGFVDPKNLGVAFEFAFLSCLVVEL